MAIFCTRVTYVTAGAMASGRLTVTTMRVPSADSQRRLNCFVRVSVPARVAVVRRLLNAQPRPCRSR